MPLKQQKRDAEVSVVVPYRQRVCWKRSNAGTSKQLARVSGHMSSLTIKLAEKVVVVNVIALEPFCKLLIDGIWG